MSDHDDEPRPEGIRIIGAAEAAKITAEQRAVGGPDRPAAEPDDDVGGDSSEGEHDLREPPPGDDRSSVGSPAPRDPDDSFELPHYSHPPTGQVPTVVSGDSPAPSTSGRPAWRGQDDDRGADIDMSDLDDDAPRLGSLGVPEEGYFDEFDDVAPRDLDTSDVESRDFAPDDDEQDELPVAPIRRRDGSRSSRRSETARPGRSRTVSSRPPSSDDISDAAFAASTGRNVGMAVVVGVGLAAIGLICFAFGSVTTMALVTVVLLLCAMEYFTVVMQRGFAPATALGMAAVAGFAIAPLYRPSTAFVIVAALVVMLGMVWYLFVEPGDQAIENLGVTLIGVFWIGGLGSFATLALGQGRPFESIGRDGSNPGIGLLLAAVLVTVLHDVGAFFVGRQFGRRPLSAASPNKTIEGLVGGWAIGVFVPLIIIQWIPGFAPVNESLAKTFGFCLLCSTVAPIGDLCQSNIKRNLGVKDMGTFLPGHGGLLDRFDAMLFVLPTAWAMAHLLEIKPF